MAPGLKRALDTLAYMLSAGVLGGGVLYALQRLEPAQAPAPPAASMPAAETAAAAPVPPQDPAAAPAAAPPPPAETPPAPANPPPSGGVLTSAHGHYELPAPTDSGSQDREAYFALRRNCDAAAANNRNGQYPALQEAACNRYTQFAAEHGWQTGSLPAYGQPPPPSAPPTDGAADSWPSDGGETVVYDAVIGGYRQVRGHHTRDATESARQIGPNYPLPPPQQPPAVSQEQHHSGAAHASGSYRAH